MSWPIALRKATEDDLPALVEIGTAAALTNVDQLPEFRQRAADLPAAFAGFLPADRDDLLVLETSQQIAGFVSADRQTGEVADLWVAPDKQRQGYGAILLAAGEAAIRQAGQSCAWLTTHEKNAGALSFYRAQGYALLSITESQGGTIPDVRYRKALLGKQLSRPHTGQADTMDDVRAAIDMLDPMLVSLVAERFAFIDRAADLKPALAMPALVSGRVEEVVANARAQAEGIGFDPDLTETLWRMMVDLAIAREEARMNHDQSGHRIGGRAS
jgi:isochorismate pyruvate lyase